MGKRNKGRKGRAAAPPPPSLPKPIVRSYRDDIDEEVDKQEVQKKSDLGFVYCCTRNRGSEEFDWYRVDSMRKEVKVTRFCAPAKVFNFGGGFTCASMGSKLFVVGGRLPFEEPAKQAYWLDKDDGWKWTSLPDMITGRFEPYVVCYQNRVYVFGANVFAVPHYLPVFAEYLDMSLPRKEWEWKPLIEPKLGGTYMLDAAFVTNIDGEDEIVLGLAPSDKTFSLNLNSLKWRNRTKIHPDLDWNYALVSVMVVDDILLVVDWGQQPMKAYHLKNRSWFPNPVTGFEEYPRLGRFLLQSKGNVYLLVPPPTSFLIFQIKTGFDPEGRSTISAVIKSKIGPFDIQRSPYFCLPLGEVGEEEEGTEEEQGAA